MIDSVYDYRLKINSLAQRVFFSALFFHHRFQPHGRCRFALAGHLWSIALAKRITFGEALASPALRDRRCLSLVTEGLSQSEEREAIPLVIRAHSLREKRHLRFRITEGEARPLLSRSEKRETFGEGRKAGARERDPSCRFAQPSFP
jgi:hypothetical protein